MLKKNPYEAKYQFLINKRESAGLKHFNDSKAFIEYSNDMDNVFKNIEKYNPNKKRKILIVLDDMIADMLSNKKLNMVVIELYIRGRKLNISIVFIKQSHFAVPKNIRLNCIHYFIIKIPNKRELQQIAFTHSSDTDFKDLLKDLNISREAAKISEFSSGKFDKSEYLTGEGVLPSDQRGVIEQVKFTYSPLRKSL